MQSLQKEKHPFSFYDIIKIIKKEFPMFPKFNSVVPPRPGTPILYICRNCGEKFTAKKKLFSLPVKCPKCGSAKCVSPTVN